MLERRARFKNRALALAPCFFASLCGKPVSTFPRDALGAEDGADPIICVDAIEAELPSATSIPLGFIVSELITNAIKYGKGQIKVRLEANTGKGYALSVSNDGPTCRAGLTLPRARARE